MSNRDRDGVENRHTKFVGKQVGDGRAPEIGAEDQDGVEHGK
jgi:hypothetical protein